LLLRCCSFSFAAVVCAPPFSDFTSFEIIELCVWLPPFGFWLALGSWSWLLLFTFALQLYRPPHVLRLVISRSGRYGWSQTCRRRRHLVDAFVWALLPEKQLDIVS
jgi:hypothetical protein